jgi:hypothetical protein
MAIVMLSFATALAAEDSTSEYVMNFDLIINKSDGGEVYYRIHQQGVHLLSKKPFHGDDLGEFDYFLTVSEMEDGKGKLSIEFYQFETRKKKSDVMSEVVAEVDFTLGSPARFEAKNDKIGVDLAFSIDQE